jgi:transposase
MKKNSKVSKGLKQQVVKRHPAETIGIDLGDKISQYVILNEEGMAVEEGRFRNSVESITKHFGNRGRAKMALEVGTQSAWISRQLEHLGHEVIVANARELKWITASDRKNDKNDALKLARLAHADRNLLAPVEHRTGEQQEELSVIRARDALVKARTLLVNTARGLAKGFGLRLPKTVTPTFGARAKVLLPEQLLVSLDGLLDQIDALGVKIHNYDQRIEKVAAKHPEVERLASVFGVGTLTATAFVLTLGRRERFVHSRDVGSYLGLRPRQKQSGERDPKLGISKSGDKYLRKLMVQCAHHVLGRWGKDSALRQWGLAKGGGAAKKRAVVAVARKLAVLLHRLWVTGQVFKPFPKMA